MCRMFISTERLSSPFLRPSSRSRRLTALLAGLRKSSRTRQPDSASRTSRRPGEVLDQQVEAYADGVEPPRAAEEVLGGELALQPHPVGVDARRRPRTGRRRGPRRRRPAAGRAEGTPRAAAEDLQQPRGGALGLGEDGLGQRPVAGDDVAGDLQLVQGQFDVAPVVEVRLEAGPVLDHQLAQLRQGEEAEDVVVGRVEQIALAAADLAYGDGPLHPLLPGRARRRRPPSRRRARARRWAAAPRPPRRAAAARPGSARCRPGRPAGRAYAPRSRRPRPSPVPADGRSPSAAPGTPRRAGRRWSPPRDPSSPGGSSSPPELTRAPPSAPRAPRLQRSRKGTPVAGGGAAGWTGRFSTPVANSAVAARRDPPE